VEEGKLIYLKLSEVHPFHTFRPHPFQVRDDAKMQETVASIKANGVMVPGLARPEKDGNGYEIVAGHRRCRGSELAGLEEMPFIVRDMTDHEAVQAMKDSNKQRDQMLPSELAALLDLEVEDIKHQGGRLKNVAEGDIGKRSVEIVGEAHGMNYKKVMRYLRLNSLVPELLNMADEKKLGFMPAVELSYIKPKNQRLVAVSIDGEQSSPSVAQAKKMRELDQEGKLTGDVIDGILSEKKKEDRGVIISTAELEKYFGKEVLPGQMKEQIIALLDEWKEKQPPELAKPDKKKTDKEK
jgi:ParB/RepB/Spo0J family partition protein